MCVPFLNFFSIALAANHCFRAHVRIRSGTINAQNISVIFLQIERNVPCLGGGMLGCIDVHVQMKMVVRQLQSIFLSVEW